MRTIKGESIIETHGNLTLTSIRFVQEKKGWGKRDTVEFRLEKIDSIRYTYRRRNWLIATGIIGLILFVIMPAITLTIRYGALFDGAQTLFYGIIFGSLIIIGILSKKEIVEIRSGSDVIVENKKGIEPLIDSVRTQMQTVPAGEKTIQTPNPPVKEETIEVPVMPKIAYYCHVCNVELSETAKFCPECGVKLER